jgi:serine/threonine protein kinase
MPADDPQTDHAGERLGRYALVRRLGKGGMGEVFLAKPHGGRGFERHVAIKRILPQYSQDRHVVNMLVDEARISVLLNHPNIVQVMELDEDRGRHFIVMEYVDGHALSRLIRRLKKKGERVDPLLACHIVSQVLEGLQAAHTQRDDSGGPAGIIHRDVSPQNVLLSMSGQVKVIDFGIARARDRLEATKASQVKGKLRYMAPEQIKPSLAGRAGIDHRVDVFAAGIVLFELVAMRARYTGQTDLEIIDAILETDVPNLEREGLVDHTLMGVLRQALARDRDRRFKDAAAFAVALRSYLYARNPSYAGAEQVARAMRRCFVDDAEPTEPADDGHDPPASERPARATTVEPDDVTRTQFRPIRPHGGAAAPSAGPASSSPTSPRAGRLTGVVSGAVVGTLVVMLAAWYMRSQQPPPSSSSSSSSSSSPPPLLSPSSSSSSSASSATLASSPPSPPPSPPPAVAPDGSVEVVVEVVPASATITRAYQPDPKFVSPARFAAKPGDTLDLQFEAVGFEPMRRTFAIEGSAPRVLVELTPIPMPVIVRPVPRDAEVTINGQPARNGRTTVTPGQEVVVVASHPFYFDETKTVVATPGLQQLVIDLTLQERPVPAPAGSSSASSSSSPSSSATMSLTSSPAGASVYVDSVKVGRTPIDLRLAPGPHRLTVRSDTAESTFAVSAVAGTQEKKHIALE